MTWKICIYGLLAFVIVALVILAITAGPERWCGLG